MPTAVTALVIVGSFVGYLVADRNSWFFYDDWEFLLNRPLTHDTLHSLFAPHNEHWSTFPVVSYRLLYALFGVHHYLAFEIPALALHAGSCVVLWALMRRAGASAWAICGGVALAAVCGGGADNLAWDFQLGFVASVFFGLLAMLVADRDLSGRRLRWTWIALILGLMSSGVGIPMGIGATVYVGLRHTWRAALTVASVPVAAYVVWFATYGHDISTTNDATPLVARLNAPAYIWYGLTNTWQANARIPNAGALLLVVIAAPVVVFGLRDRLGRLAIALLSADVGLFLVLSWTRVRFGVDEASVSRYVYVSTMLTVVAAVWSATALVQLSRDRVRGHRPTPVIAAVAGTVVLAVVAMISDAQQIVGDHERLVAGSKSAILGTAQLIRQGAPLLTCCPYDKYNRSISLAELSRRGVLDELPTVQLTPGDELSLRALAQVTVQPGAHAMPMDGTVTITSTHTTLTSGGCAAGTANAGQPVVVEDESGTASVTVSTSGPIYTAMRYHGMTSAPSMRTMPASTGQAAPFTVTLSQPGAAVRVFTDAGVPVTVCRA